MMGLLGKILGAYSLPQMCLMCVGKFLCYARLVLLSTFTLLQLQFFRSENNLVGK